MVLFYCVLSYQVMKDSIGNNEFQFILVLLVLLVSHCTALVSLSPLNEKITGKQRGGRALSGGPKVIQTVVGHSNFFSCPSQQNTKAWLSELIAIVALDNADQRVAIV